MDDADTFMTQNALQLQMMYAHALSIFPGRMSFWSRANALEKCHTEEAKVRCKHSVLIKRRQQLSVVWFMSLTDGYVKEALLISLKHSVLIQTANRSASQQLTHLPALKLNEDIGVEFSSVQKHAHVDFMEPIGENGVRRDECNFREIFESDLVLLECMLFQDKNSYYASKELLRRRIEAEPKYHEDTDFQANRASTKYK
ncbi:unnamed protein product [Albugo candida]|uniref:Uncharacterized protein n=1 Tax=Albugo candida TaxID=65357 RepID=A0A024FUI4_9STRA|nr:unnamed protein product [Albugo candida]|eukprot:CCI10790.1 unnamed protein product [Albugo candida]